MALDHFWLCNSRIEDPHYPNNFILSGMLLVICTPPSQGILEKKSEITRSANFRRPLARTDPPPHQLNFSAMIPSFSFQRWRKPTPIVVRRFPFIFWRNFLSTSLKHCLLAGNFWALSWRISQKSHSTPMFHRSLSDRWGIFFFFFFSLCFNCFSPNHSLMDVASN